MNDVVLAIIGGLSIGFLGSVHCIGMCGPLALALPVGQGNKLSALYQIGMYNLGRACVYALLGILVGFIGSRFNVWGLQQWLSISAGILILFFAVMQFKIALRYRWLQAAHAFIQRSLSHVLRSAKGPFTFFFIGNLNALLPCGLVYVGLTSALATGGIMQGGWLMFFFGIGTTPAMVSVMLLRNRFSFSFRKKLNRAVPYVVSVMAILLILRGMNLGIAYVSPARTMDTLTMPSCHNAR